MRNIAAHFYFIGCLAAAVIAPISSSATEYRIGPLEKLKIKVYEWPALSDELTVSPEGTISLPIVGQFQAAGTTATELATAIASQLQVRAELKDKPFTSVEISQFRPYYVLGDVQRPGDYAYRPNMTVLMALSIAGGVYRASDGMAANLLRDIATSSSTLSSLEAKKLELLVRRARLNAELAQTENFVLADKSEYPVQIIQEEQGIMGARKSEFQSKIAGYRKQIQLSLEEIALLKERFESGNKKINSLEKELAGLRSLNERGLGLASRQGELDRLAAQYEGDQREIDTLINRARQAIAQAETSILLLTNEREQAIRIDLRQVSGQIDDLEQQKAMHQKLLFGAERMGAAVQAERSARLSFRISRRNGSEVSEFDVEQSDFIEPGDVVIVDQKKTQDGSQFGFPTYGIATGIAKPMPQ